MESTLTRAVALAVYAVAGGGMFLFLLNRRLLLIPDNRWKMPAILVALVLLVGLAVLSGWMLPVIPWTLAPACVIAALLAGEAWRHIIRRRCAGSPPVETATYNDSSAGPFTTTDLMRLRYEATSPAWHGRLLRIVHFSDFHFSPNQPYKYFERVFQCAEEAEADLAFLTGDFISSARHLDYLNRILRPVARHGTFAVLGNHDYWAGAPAVRDAVREAGITLLTNDWVEMEINGGRLAISGDDHPWGIRHTASPQFSQDVLHLVMSHTPDNIYRLNRSGADIVFSGHNHAGQVRIPLIGSIVVPSHFGRRFDHGHFVVRGTHLFVTAGIGASRPSFRLYCPPDIFIVDISGFTNPEQRLY